MLGPLRHHERVTFGQPNRGLETALIAKGDVEPSSENQEELVSVVVAVPDVITERVGDSYVIVVHRGHNAGALGRSKAHLIRSFTAAYGIAPHAYLNGRRVEAARKLLLQGVRPAEVAAAVGFYDQSHLTRHFKRHTSVPPATFATSHQQTRS